VPVYDEYVPRVWIWSLNYQQQIQLLESRIQQLETQQQETEQALQESKQPVQEQSKPNAFNPAVALTLNGRYQIFSKDRGDVIAGFSPPGEAGMGSEGFSLGESELNFQSNVDDLFFANLTLSLADDNGDTSADLEEAWLQTLAMPGDMTLKAGRFFSGIA